MEPSIYLIHKKLCQVMSGKYKVVPLSEVDFKNEIGLEYINKLEYYSKLLEEYIDEVN